MNAGLANTCTVMMNGADEVERELESRGKWTNLTGVTKRMSPPETQADVAGEMAVHDDRPSDDPPLDDKDIPF